MKTFFKQLSGALIGTLIGLFIGATVWGHATPTGISNSGVLRVQRLEIGPAKGAPGIVLQQRPLGYSEITLSCKGTQRFLIQAAPDGGLFWMLDRDGTPGISMMADKLSSIRVRTSDGNDHEIADPQNAP